MQAPKYYREKAAQARKLAPTAGPETASLLQCMERDYTDLAVDLEDGAIELIHPELMPQLRHGSEMPATKPADNDHHTGLERRMRQASEGED